MGVWWNFEQEAHNLINIHNLQIVQSIARFEVRTPGKANGLHHVGEQVVQLHLHLLPGPELLGLVFLSTWHYEGWIWLGHIATDT